MSLVRTTLLVAALALPAVPAQAGCIKGAIVGGLAGKLVGHGYAGAAAGCAYGVHKSRQNARRDNIDNGRGNDAGRRY